MTITPVRYGLVVVTNSDGFRAVISDQMFRELCCMDDDKDSLLHRLEGLDFYPNQQVDNVCRPPTGPQFCQFRVLPKLGILGVVPGDTIYIKLCCGRSLTDKTPLFFAPTAYIRGKGAVALVSETWAVGDPKGMLLTGSVSYGNRNAPSYVKRWSRELRMSDDSPQGGYQNAEIEFIVPGNLPNETKLQVSVGEARFTAFLFTQV